MTDLHTYLASKTLIMLVGPTAIGKSTLMNEAVRQDARFSRVKSFTTRPKRSNDEENQYFYFSDTELHEQTEGGSIVTDVIFPTTGYHYGTTIHSYGTEFNLLDTLSHSVESYRQLPFKTTVTVSLTASSDDWRRWLEQRYPVTSQDRMKRIEEAVMSIEWSLHQTSGHRWLVNNPHDLTNTVNQLLAVATHTQETEYSTPLQAEELLRTAKSLLSYG
jgi:guanylate kinase